MKAYIFLRASICSKYTKFQARRTKNKNLKAKCPSESLSPRPLNFSYWKGNPNIEHAGDRHKNLCLKVDLANIYNRALPKFK